MTMNDIVLDDFDEEEALFKQSDILKNVLIDMFEHDTNTIEVIILFFKV